MVQAVVGSKPTYTPANTLTHTATQSHICAVDFSPFLHFLEDSFGTFCPNHFVIPVLFEPKPISHFFFFVFLLVCKVPEQHVESFVYLLTRLGCLRRWINRV